MSDAIFVKDPVGWHGFAEAPNGTVQSAMYKRAKRVQRLAKAQVGKKTGRLRQSINVTLRTGPLGPEWWIGSNLDYALPHHQGTRPRIIVPKRDRVLRFSSKGKIVYARVVHHPGTKPNRYLTDNLRRVVND